MSNTQEIKEIRVVQVIDTNGEPCATFVGAETTDNNGANVIQVQTVEAPQLVRVANLDDQPPPNTAVVVTENGEHVQSMELEDFGEDLQSDNDGKSRRKRTKPLQQLTIREKTAICRYKAMHPDANHRQIAEHFSALWNKDVPRRRVGDILVQKEKWFDVERRIRDDADKAFRDGRFSHLERLTYDWVLEVSRSGGRIWDDDIQGSARKLAEVHEIKNFVASNAWLCGFKRRYGLKNNANGEIQVNLNSDIEFTPTVITNRETSVGTTTTTVLGSDSSLRSYTVNVELAPAEEMNQQQSVNVGSSHHGGALLSRGGMISHALRTAGGSGNDHDVDLSSLDSGSSDEEDAANGTHHPDPNIGLSQPPSSMVNSVDAALAAHVAPSGHHQPQQHLVLDDLVKTIIYGTPASSASAVVTAVTNATQVPLSSGGPVPIGSPIAAHPGVDNGNNCGGTTTTYTVYGATTDEDGMVVVSAAPSQQQSVSVISSGVGAPTRTTAGMLGTNTSSANVGISNSGGNGGAGCSTYSTSGFTSGGAAASSHFDAGSSPIVSRKRAALRASLTAKLVRKVLVATKRRVDMETDMLREQKMRHLAESKLLEEKRRRSQLDRELVSALKRKVDAESKLLAEQQRNELIKRELLLAELGSAKQSVKTSGVSYRSMGGKNAQKLATVVSEST